jgi:hypothetical protein
VVVGHYQPLADNVAVAATSDPTCLLQSTQKAKRRGLKSTESTSLRSPIEVELRTDHSPGVSKRLKSTGFARDFRVISKPTTIQRSDVSMGSGR